MEPVTTSLAVKAAVSVGSQVLQSPKGRRALVVTVVAVILVVVLPVAGFFVGVTALLAAAAGDEEDLLNGRVAQIEQDCFTPVAVGTQAETRWADLNAEQQDLAAQILAVVRGAVVVPGGADEATQRRAGVVAIATAMQESELRNLAGGDRDSLGLFQQRPSQAWGTPEQITDPVYATTAFLYGAGTNPGLVDVTGWADAPVTVAAQAVQRSGYPEAYAKWESFALDVVAQAWDTATPVPVHPALDRSGLADGTATLRPVSINYRAGNTGCELLGDDVTPVEWDGVYKHPQAWGGYSNGRIPLAAMCVIPFAPAHVARCDAVDAIVLVNEAYKRDHGGKSLIVSSSYRSYEAQVATKRAKGRLAATPGKSNHGWGLALDFGGFGGEGVYTMPNYLWMMANGPKYGWVNPPFMQEGGSGPLEPWHWEFMGEPGAAPTPPQVAVGVLEGSEVAVAEAVEPTPSGTPTPPVEVTESDGGLLIEDRVLTWDTPQEEVPPTP